MDTAFKLAHHDSLYAQHTADQAAAQKAEETRQQKLAAQSAQGGGTRPPDPDAQQQVWDEIVKAGASRFRT
jgi:hypothetical protein